jgi:hypothetical protein
MGLSCAAYLHFISFVLDPVTWFEFGTCMGAEASSAVPGF